MRVNLFLLAGLLLGSDAALAGADAPDAGIKLEPAFKDKMTVLTNGKGRYLAVHPYSNADHRFFYGDGKNFVSVPVNSSFSQEPTRFSLTFPDPRFVGQGRFNSNLELSEGKYVLQCGDRKIELQPVDGKTARPMLDTATYGPSPRKWRSHALARDSRGTYYYVDRGRTRGTEGQFRLFVGPKGNLVQQKMTNVVSDSQGDIFSTKSGDLRLILDASPDRSATDGIWIKNEKPMKLTIVPIDANIAMIHNDLGVYAGERLGMPCDDL
jgi:hypothetical protein